MIKIENIRLFNGSGFDEDACLLIDGGKIRYAGSQSECPAHEAERIDGRNDYAMPGFYNAHSHAAMTLFRGVGSDLALMDWLDLIVPREEKLDEDCVYWGTTLAIAEMARRGTVAFMDSYYMLPQIVRAAMDAHMRLNVCRGCSTVEGVDSVVEAHERYHGAMDDLIHVYMGLHAEYTSTREVAGYAIEAAKAKGMGFCVHMAETRTETDGCIQRHGVTPVQYFHDLGADQVPMIAAHCVHVTDEDIDLLKEGNVFVAHNPSSNLKLASGIAPIDRMIKKGVCVALGTDGAASNNGLDMISDMRLASLLQKGATLDPTAMNTVDSVRMATRNGALAMGYQDAGELKTGMRADVILIDSHAENMTPANDPLSDIVFAASGMNVVMTMVNGKVLYRDGQFLTLDIEETKRKAIESVEKLRA